MKMFLLSTSLILSSSLAFADVSVIGLTLNKTTVEDLQKVYPSADCSYENNLTHARDCDIPSNAIRLNGVTDSVVTNFDNDGTLQLVYIIVDKNNFDQIKSMLDSKYTQTKSEIPFVGNKYIEYSKDNSTISLSAPHMSFQMDLEYVTNYYDNKITIASKEKEQNEQQAQAALL